MASKASLWTEEELKQLHRVKNGEITYRECAKITGRSLDACYHKAKVEFRKEYGEYWNENIKYSKKLGRTDTIAKAINSQRSLAKLLQFKSLEDFVASMKIRPNYKTELTTIGK